MSTQLPPCPPETARGLDALQVVLSFDVEEHHRIEAAAGLTTPPDWQAHYRERVDMVTRWLLDELARREVRATFFLVGETARDNPALVRDIHRAGHEVASHGWDHRRVHHFTPDTFREDLRQSKDILEQITGAAVVGYRAPTFSVMRQTAWAIDVLAESGLLYDSSIYPVRHDRYGVPDAPRQPFRVVGERHDLLELPPLTWRVAGMNLPVGGGGYFRLLPLALMKAGMRQAGRTAPPALAMLYFHPWEFDPDQQRLPLRRLSRWRTYVGIPRSRTRLATLLADGRFTRARDVAESLAGGAEPLPRFHLAGEPDVKVS